MAAAALQNTGKTSAATATKSAGKASPAKAAANTPAAFSREDELHAYREMLMIRRFEEKSGQLYGMGLIGGFCHLYIGQEAVVVGMQMASLPATRLSRAIATMATCWPAAWTPRASWPS